MSKPAFIVEGQQEQFIMKKICPNTKVVRLGVNGDHASMEAVATRISALYNSFGNRHFPIVIIFDRERRKSSCTDLRAELVIKMRSLDLPVDQFVISIIDRTFEAWILPFIGDDGRILERPNASYDGKNCTSELIRKLRKSGIDYHKTTNGVDLFCAISPTELSKISPSFYELRQSIISHCKWMETF